MRGDADWCRDSVVGSRSFDLCNEHGAPLVSIYDQGTPRTPAEPKRRERRTRTGLKVTSMDEVESLKVD